MCFSVCALNYADRTAITAVFPLIRSELSMSDVELAAVGSFFLWAYALASPLAGMLADRVSRSRMIVWSLVGWSMLTLITAFVTTTGQLLCTRVLLGFFEAAYLPAAIALIADYHSPRTRATAIGLNAAGLAFGVASGGTGLGYIGEHFGWRYGFLFLGAIGLLLAIIAHLVLRDAPADDDARDTREQAPPLVPGILQLARVPSYLIVILASMTIAIGDWIFVNWLPLYFKESFQMSLAEAGFAGTFTLQGAVLTGGITGSMFSDRFAGKKPRRRMLIQLLSYLFAAPVLLVFFFRQPELILLNACIFTFAFLLGFGSCNVSPLTCELLPPKLRSTAIGVNNSANCFAGGLGIMVAGLLKSRIGLAPVFGGICGTILIATGILLVGYLFFLARDLARQTGARKAAAGPAAASASR